VQPEKRNQKALDESDPFAQSRTLSSRWSQFRYGSASTPCDSSTIYRMNLKKAYLDGWRILSYFIVLAFLIGLAHFLTVMVFELLSGFAPMGSEKRIGTKIESAIEVIAFLIYAPLISYYHHQWDAGSGRETTEAKDSEVAE